MSDCIFCRIVAGDLPSEEVASTERTYAFRDVKPALPVHVLVVPREHISSADTVEAGHADVLAEMMETAQAVARQEGLSDRGYRLVFNVGDSRTYRLNQGILEQISVDHSEVQELLEAGRITAQEALVHPRRHVVTRALGTGDDSEPDFWMLPVEAGDRKLICSDGLTSEVSDEHIHAILSSTVRPQDAVQALIQAALCSGGRDNITAIVVDAADVAQDAEQAATAPRTEDEETDTLPRLELGGSGPAGQQGHI